jgi:hypothetical protein
LRCFSSDREIETGPFSARSERILPGVWKSPSGRWQKRKPGRRRGKKYPIAPASLAALAAVNRARRLRAQGFTEATFAALLAGSCAGVAKS